MVTCEFEYPEEHKGQQCLGSEGVFVPRSLHLVQRLLRLLWEQSQGKEAVSTSPSNNSSSISNTFSSLNTNNNHNPATSAALAATNNQPSLSSQTTSVIFTLLSTLLANNPHPQDLLRSAQPCLTSSAPVSCP